MPHVQQIETDLAALVVIDVQEKMLGAISSDPQDELIQRMNKLIRTATLLDVPVIYTEQYPKGLGPTDKRLTETLDGSAAYFEKATMSCWRDRPFASALKEANREHVILCGLETHVCILQTALDLRRVDFEVFIAEDAVGSRFDRDKQVALDRMRSADVTVSTTESLMFELIGRCDHPKFKSFLEIVKS